MQLSNNQINKNQTFGALMMRIPPGGKVRNLVECCINNGNGFKAVECIVPKTLNYDDIVIIGDTLGTEANIYKALNLSAESNGIKLDVTRVATCAHEKIAPYKTAKDRFVRLKDVTLQKVGLTRDLLERAELRKLGALNYVRPYPDIPKTADGMGRFRSENPFLDRIKSLTTSN